MQTQTIIAGIPVTINKNKGQKNLYIRVMPPDGDVVISAPYRMSQADIEKFFMSKLAGIEAAREKVKNKGQQNAREYVSGETHYLWGEPYRLEVLNDGDICHIKKTQSEIIMTVPEWADADTRERVLNELYRYELRRALGAVVSRCESRTGLHANEYRIKNMKTRWGSCNIDKRRVWLSLHLAKKPPECLEYVVTHELVHLLERNHNKRFYALVEEFYPQWREAKAKLEE